MGYLMIKLYSSLTNDKVVFFTKNEYGSLV